MPPWAWKTALGTLAAIDAYAAFVRHDGTLSHVIRETCHTDTPAGRRRLVLIWAGASAWLLPHLAIWPKDRR